MNFKLLRNQFSGKSTIGELYLEGVRLCYTLEDCDRGLTQDMSIEEIERLKVYGKTCIPYGHYQIKWQPSMKFQKDMPYIQNVPGYSGVMVHQGNVPDDTLGCILLGMAKGTDRIMQSTGAYGMFKALWVTHKDTSDWIEIIKGGDSTIITDKVVAV